MLDTISLRKVSEVPPFNLKGLPADKLHCLNFITMSFKMEYFKLNSEVVPANSNVTKPIFMTSGCYILKCLDHIFKQILFVIHPFIDKNIPTFGYKSFWHCQMSFHIF